MRVIGLGNALTDVLAILNSDECIQEMGLLKGGMQLIDEDKLLKIMAMFEDFDTFMASGGSTANTLSGLTRMGIETGFIGKIGHDPVMENSIVKLSKITEYKPILSKEILPQDAL